MSDRPGENPWEFPTPQAGEAFTPEGKISAVGRFARGVRTNDARVRAFRADMRRTAVLVVVYGAIVLGVAVGGAALLAALL